MAHALEIKPLIVAAIIGAVALSLVDRECTTKRKALMGAGLGMLVQFGVRITGVS